MTGADVRVGNYRYLLNQQTLIKNGITRCFLYSDDFLEVETYMLQVDKNRLFRSVDQMKRQYIYGFSLLGLLLYEDLSDMGCCCSYVLQNGISRDVLPTGADVATLNKSGFLHISMEMENKDYIGEYQNYYDLIDNYDFYNEKLETFRNKHKGERCFIVATGPSLRIEDLDTLNKNNEICISMNGIFKAYDQTRWRPNYFMIADPNCMYFNKDVVKKMDDETVFLSDIISDQIDKSNVYRWHLRRRWEKGRAPEFSDDFSRVTYAGLTVTYDGALQLAVFMGFTEIYLVGVDCSNYNASGTVHFFDRYGKVIQEETRLLDVNQNILAYESAKKYADNHGIIIKNATRGGKLEVFDRVDFDSLFEGRR